MHVASRAWLQRLLMLTLLSAAGCGGAVPSRLVAAASDSAGLRITRLSMSIREVSAGRAHAETLVSDPHLRTGNIVRRVAAIVGLDSSRFAVLDREKRQIVFLERGSAVWVAGRITPLPPQAGLPLAMVHTAGTDEFVVWFDDKALAFAKLNRAGTLLRSSPWIAAGDWRAFVYREPFMDWEFPLQIGVEDLTSRVRPLAGGAFLTALMPNGY